ncbi:hypothetical protein LTR20_007367 [Exophiala xenobiotica]|nr:hypothetical protein LTS06_008038 [Exophiala xenobiotica]KAK5283500.1 hypothetical protein LTR40_001643 [Exophiala xenobiotica]KAK5401230.1 hypothetical protein LTR79_001749 [Exophiala xenobiotica]KAK5405953.1 hypothetical protein LTR90_010764 [Exophiala xenobiotica]KAK5460060.1 hypothetical protein LTR20_007367 [Exophiala xenobiotica]
MILLDNEDERADVQSDKSGHPHKNRRSSEHRLTSSVLSEDLAPENSQTEWSDQLPSPSATKPDGAHTQLSHVDTLTRKRKTRSPDCTQSDLKRPKKARLHSQPSDTGTSIKKWLSSLPGEDFDELKSMSLPPPKRSRSSDSLGRTLSQSGDGTESTISRDRKYSAYKDVNYPVVLETKGSFMRSSGSGLVDEDKILYERLLSTSQTPPSHSLFDERFDKFHSLIRGRSEARVYLDLHPLLVPSAENLYISGQEEFSGLIEGHNDLWVKAIPFYGPRPQPDHTYGFRWSNFTETQRRKLGIEPSEKSYYTAREDIYFPFLVSEVKCGKQGLDLADRPNAHSMTIALRGIVDVYRKAGRAAEVHRRVLGFSMSHDDRSARIYGHYPEIDGESTTYFRDTIRELTFGDGKGKDRWQCYQFTLNVCQNFAPSLLKRLTTVTDELPDPIEPTQEPASFDDFSIQSSQDDSSAPESQDEGFRKPRRGGGLNAEFRTMIQNMQRQLEQQRKDAKDREATLTAQLEQQRKDSEQQRKELLQVLKEQSEQIKELLRKR